MDQSAFEQYLDQQPKTEGTQAVGRYIKNAFGVDERVVLPDSYWRYLDWLQDEAKIDITPFIIECDEKRGAFTLSHSLMDWTYRDMINRQEKGWALPAFLELI